MSIRSSRKSFGEPSEALSKSKSPRRKTLDSSSAMFDDAENDENTQNKRYVLRAPAINGHDPNSVLKGGGNSADLSEILNDIADETCFSIHEEENFPAFRSNKNNSQKSSTTMSSGIANRRETFDGILDLSTSTLDASMDSNNRSSLVLETGKPRRATCDPQDMESMFRELEDEDEREQNAAERGAATTEMDTAEHEDSAKANLSGISSHTGSTTRHSTASRQSLQLSMSSSHSTVHGTDFLGNYCFLFWYSFQTSPKSFAHFSFGCCCCCCCFPQKEQSMAPLPMIVSTTLTSLCPKARAELVFALLPRSAPPHLRRLPPLPPGELPPLRGFLVPPLLPPAPLR
jgi:hypothetical protein